MTTGLTVIAEARQQAEDDVVNKAVAAMHKCAEAAADAAYERGRLAMCNEIMAKLKQMAHEKMELGDHTAAWYCRDIADKIG